MQVVINNVTAIKVKKAIGAIEAEGGTVIGPNFSVQGVDGSYVLNGSTLTIVITKKPWYAPENVIETKLRAFFA